MIKKNDNSIAKFNVRYKAIETEAKAIRESLLKSCSAIRKLARKADKLAMIAYDNCLQDEMTPKSDIEDIEKKLDMLNMLMDADEDYVRFVNNNFSMKIKS